MRRGLALICLWTALLALAAAPAQAYIIGGRWTKTATNNSTGTTGTPITVTWSFPPDGTQIPGNTGFSTVPSNLINFLDTNWPGGSGSDLSQRPWFFIFQQSVDRITALSGVTFIYDPQPSGFPALDDGRAFANSTSAQGTLGVRGDIRIGGKSYGAGSTTLASNYYPNYGEMMINTDKADFFNCSTCGNNNYRRFRNTVMHELFHGLGIDHIESSNAAFLLEPSINATFDGPQLDDLLAIQRNYGDVYEKNGGNDTYDRATPLGLLSPTLPRGIGALGSSTTISATQTDFISIDDDSDTDFFSFSVEQRYDVRLQLTPRGTSYLVGPEGGTQTTLNTLTLSNLSLALYDTNGTSLLQLADSNPAGSGEEILRQLLPGTYYARVKGQQNNIQLYGLNLSATVPLPRNLVWVGNFSSTWNVSATANFSDSGASTVFYPLDHAWFNDTSAVKSVTLSGNIEAGLILVTTATAYTFSGSGSITAGSLTIDGLGIVTLANSGNSYSGPTQVASGTLRLTGNANAMVSPITVANGARLMLDSSSLGTLGSSLTISGNGGGNGAILVAASRTATFTGNTTIGASTAAIHVDSNGTGTFQGTVNGVAQNARLTLQVGAGGNLALQNNVSLGAGGITKVGAGIGTLGGALSYSGATIVDQGTLRLTGNGSMAGEFRVAQGATLDFAGTHQLQSAARLTGSGTVAGNVSMPGTIAPGTSPGTLTFNNNLALTGTSVIDIEIGGTVPGFNFDVLSIAGAATLAGTLDVSLIDSFDPAQGHLFEVLRADAGIFGEFDDLLLPRLASQLEWNVVYSNFAVLLQVVSQNATMLPGDYNGDSVVDAADYVVWRKTLGDPGDYNVWTTNFGQVAGTTGASASATFSAVPEPAGAAMAIAALLLASLCRRYRRGG